MSKSPRLSVILVSYNTRNLTLRALKSVYHSRGLKPSDLEVIVVDNHSTDDTLDALRREYPQVKLIANSKNRGFGAGNNQGARASRGEYLLLLNTDAFLAPDSLSLLLAEFTQDPTLLAVAPQLTSEDGSLQQSCGYLPTLPRLIAWMLALDKLPLLKKLFPKPYHHYDLSCYHTPLNPEWLMGACLLIRRADFLQVQGFDEKIFMYAEEVELFTRLKTTFPDRRLLLTPTTQVIHLGSSSTKNAQASRLLLEIDGLIHLYAKHYPTQLSLARFFIRLGVALRLLAFTLLPSRHGDAREYRKYFVKPKLRVE